MTRARAILLGSAASIFFAALTPALALTPDQRVFLFGSPFVPMWQCILTTGVLCPGITVNSPSLGGLVADATGALTYKPNNLLTYSNTFSNAAWTFYNINTPVDNSAVGPSGASTAATVTLSGSGLRQIGLKHVLPTHAYNRILTFNVKIGSGVRYFQILTDGVPTSYANFDLQAGTVGTSGATASNPMITPLGNGWYQISLVDTSQISTVIYCYTVDTINAIWSATSAAAAGSTYYVTSATASAVTYETSPRPQDQVITTASAYYGPAFDYQQGLRIWEQRVNYAPYSQALTSGLWSCYQCLAATSAVRAPDGSTFFKVTNNTLTGTAAILSPHASLTTTGTYVASVYTKAGTTPYLSVGMNDAAGHFAYVYFDAATLAKSGTRTLGGTTVVDYNAVNLGGGIYRLWIEATYSIAPSTGLTASALGSDDTSGNTGTGGDATKYAYFWGAQIGPYTFEGPYIPTGTAAVTASADSVTLTGTPVATFNGPAASAIVETSGIFKPGSWNVSAISLNGTVLGLFWNNGTRAAMGDLAGSHYLTTTSSLSLASTQRIAGSWDGTGRSVTDSGSAVVSDEFTNNYSGTLSLGSNSGNYLDGYIHGLSLYNKRLPNSVLQLKEIVGSPY